MKERLINFLGFIWTLPVSILVWLFIFILMCSDCVNTFRINKDFSITWYILPGSWFYRKMTQWAGWSGGCNIVIFSHHNDFHDVRTELHESCHVHQQYKYGFIFPVIYIVESLRIYFFDKDKHSYYDNCFEIEARKKAGQPVKIPKEKWDGDRWLFW